HREPYLRPKSLAIREPLNCPVVGSVRFADASLWLFPLTMVPPISWLEAGPELVTYAMRDRVFQSLDLRGWTSSFPHGGFHIDLAKRTLTFWEGSCVEGFTHVSSGWTGWEIHYVEDRFEEQLALCDGRLVFPPVDTEELLTRLSDPVSRSLDHNPATCRSPKLHRPFNSYS